MIRYGMFFGRCFVTTREEHHFQDELLIEMPFDGKVIWNGVAYKTSLCTARIPKSSVKPKNAVFFVFGGRTVQCEGIVAERESASPESGEMGCLIVEMAQSIKSLSEEVKELKKMVKSHEEQINHAELF